MPDSLALYVLLVVALAVGFLLGRRDRRRRPRDLGVVTEDYFKGLNHLLNERHDLAIDTFVESMAVDNDTVDTHLALGSLVRRRGEVDQAIRIHQNLLARPVLSAGQRRQVELELARDYLVAGLLDRAESLLLELVGRGGEERRTARELLLEIYQREKEWAKAVAVGRELARQDRGVRARLAHFECELAEEHLAAGDLKGARAALSRGARHDGQCARVLLLTAAVEHTARRYREACAALRRACQLDNAVVGECLEPYREACEALGKVRGYRDFLEERLRVAPALPVIEALAAELERAQGGAAALEFRLQTLDSHPSLGGLVKLLEKLERNGAGVDRAQLEVVLKYCQALLKGQPRYRCRQCGFGSSALMWQCPSCRNWGVLKPTAALDVVSS